MIPGRARALRGWPRGRALVLHGDPAVRWALARTVRRLGLLAATAAGCAAAVDCMVAARPSLVLIDTELPGWFDLLIALRSAFAPPVPVLLTGRSGRPAPHALSLPLCLHAPKPTDLGALAALVAAWVALAGPAGVAAHPRRGRPSSRPRPRPARVAR